MSTITSDRARRRAALRSAMLAALLAASTAQADVDVRKAERVVSDAATPGAFGIAAAVLDFDGDGENELAVADVVETVDGGGMRGVVRIMRRNIAGVWQANHEAALNSGDALFGLALATGDFDEDGREDLLIGAPGHGSGGGAVYLLYHSTPTTISQAGIILNNGATLGNCGLSLAVSDFNGDGNLDFATGCPSATVDAVASAGRVQVAYGFGNGSFSTGFLSQSSAGVGGGPESGDAFGSSLAVGNYNCDFFLDLAIGAPGENVDGGVETGALHVLFGSLDDGLTGTGSQLWHQGVADVPGTSGNGDRFATTLASGNFVGSVAVPACNGLAIGIPDDAETPGGSVLVLHGSGSGLVAANAQVITVSDLLPDGSGFPPDPAPDSNHRMGIALHAANLGRGFATDLVIGLEGYTPFMGEERSGMACIAYGASLEGLLGEGRRCFSGTQFGFGAESDASFASALATGDLDGASGNELVIGARGTNQAFVLQNGLFFDGFEGSAD